VVSRHDHSAIGWRDLARQTAVAYFSQLILTADRSFRTGEMLRISGDSTAKLASSGKKWRARQDSNLRPSA